MRQLSVGMRMKRVRLAATSMIVVTALFWCYWVTRLLRWLVPFTFGGGMQSSRWIDDGVTVSVMHAGVYFVSVLVMALIGSFACWAAIKLLLALRGGAFFSLQTCRRIQVFGMAIVGAMIADTVLAASLQPILTWANPVDGPVGYVEPRYVYDSGDISLALCGFGFFIIGWVFAVGAQIEAENKEFI